MWVWQSQAPSGTSKFTGVDGCEDLASAFLLLFMLTPAAMEASIILRRVSIVVLPGVSVFDVAPSVRRSRPPASGRLSGEGLAGKGGSGIQRPARSTAPMAYAGRARRRAPGDSG